MALKHHNRQSHLRYHSVLLPLGLSGHDYWVGANNEYVDGVYHWVDGTKVKMGTPFWGSADGHQEPGFPNTEHCAILFSKNFYFMHDLDCEHDLYPICEAT